MRLRRTRSQGSLSSMLGELFGSRGQRRPRSQSLLGSVERFEERKMLALTIDAITTPAVGSTDVDLATDLVLTFNEPVVKGQGNIYVVEQATGQAGVWVDVRDAAVSVSGADVSIDLPADLVPDNTYSVYIDPGAFVDSSTTPTAGATLLTQDFEFVNLEPFINETDGDGTDFSTTGQFGFTFETTLDPTKGIDEWRGWSFADKASWISADNQSRDQFALGEGTVMVGDSDEYDDGNAAETPWVGYSYTKPVDLTGVAANSVTLEFDSSFRHEAAQLGTVEVTFDGGATWTELLRLDGTNTSGSGSPAQSASINERLVSGTATGIGGDGKGGATFAAVNNPDSGSMQFRFYSEGDNDWWWAIDNMLITGDIVGVPYDGLTDGNGWTFSTPESPKFTISIDSSAINENGGTATATLSRNSGPLVPSGEVVVTLTSSDETEITVPATVTIPDGQLSVTFPVTAVDDAEIDRTQTVTITASADPFAAGTGTILVLDDEGPKVVSVTPDYASTGVDYQTSLTVEFDKEVVKGAGIIRVVYASSGEQVAEIDVASADVTVSGTTMTVVLPDLPGYTEYNVLMDDGVVISTSTALFSGVVLMQENFDALPLLDFADSLVGPGVGDGTDYTFQNPLGFSVDNSQMPPGGSSPFEGWSYMDKNSWIAEQGNQSRSQFARGSGTVVVADGDAWDDYPHEANLYMNTFLVTRPVDLAGITPGSVTLEFDSSYYHELPQFGTVEVSYDGGATWGPLLFFGDEFVPGIADGSSRNDHITVGSSNAANDIIGGAIVDAPLNTPSSGTLQFKFGYQNAGNNWWWAIDNIVIRGERAGEPFAGLVGDAWSFTTGEAPTLAVTFDSSTITETGTATGTVTRNMNLAGELVVTLASSDVTAATVPATVTIADGEASATFTITAVDDDATDGNQVTAITATADAFFAGEADLTVADDDFPQLVSATPAGGSAAAAVDGGLTLVFDQNVRKGNGYISIINATTGVAVESISVQSTDVAVAADTVTITRTQRLIGLTNYYVRIDNGAFLAEALGTADAVPMMLQDFERLALGAAVDEDPLKGDGTDWTATAPAGWTVDNTNNGLADPTAGVAEYRGWTFVDKDAWNAWSGQGRDSFTLSSGTVAVADTDEFDDKGSPGAMDTLLISPSLSLAAVSGTQVAVEFDSSFRPEGGGGGFADGNQTGVVDVTFDGGTTWTNLLTMDGSTSDGSLTDPSVNRHEMLVADIPAGATSMQVRWGQQGTNDYWWAIDNVNINASMTSPSFPGVTDTTTIAFTTEDATSLPVLESAALVGGTSATDVSAPITLAFNQPMQAGNGFIHLVETATGFAVESFNVNTDVTFTGNNVVITPTSRLGFETGYHVRIDQGALLTVAAEARTGVPVMLQDFELLALGAAVDENAALGDGTDWTATPPADWTVDNTNNGVADPTAGVAEYRGWTFLNKDVWNAWSGQGRDSFTLASGTVAVADTDEFDDKGSPGAMDTLLVTPSIDLSTVTSTDLTIEFDSSFRPEGGGGGFADGNQTGVVEVTFDDGATWTNLLTMDGSTSDGSLTDPSVNRHESLTATIPAGATAAQVRWHQRGTNDYWWAIDNVRITGDVAHWAYEGVSDSTSIAFTTMADIIPDLVSLAPANGATDAAVDADITLTFDSNVKKGNGFVHIVETSTGVAVESISVNSAAVTIAGATVTINPASDLTADTAYHVKVDRGAILGVDATTRAGVPVMLQDFEMLPLGAAVTETGGDGTDWTATAPGDWTVDNSNMPTGGVPEYTGWTFIDKETWNTWSGQGRDSFTLASGTVAVADTDEFDDITNGGPFNSLLVSPVIDLSSVTSSEVAIEFDSSFRPEGSGGGVASGNQTGVVEVTFDDGTTWTNLLTLDGDSSTGDLTDPSVNRHEVLTATIPAGATTMQVRWGQQGTNDYWWAIDNVEVSATVDGYEFAGISDAAAFAFTTAPASNDVVTDVADGQTVTDTTVYTGDQVIVKTGAGTLILNLANSHTGGLRVEAGTVIIQNVAALNGGPLVINAGATVKLDVGSALVALSSLTLDVTGRLDVGGGGFTVADGGFTAADIRAALISGRNGGTWDGTAGITYTVQGAAAAATSFAVGYAVGTNGLLTARYTASGDLQLDGKVDFDDILALFPNYGAAGSFVWAEGDVTYDGNVDFDDILALFPNYGADAVFGAGFGTGGGSGAGTLGTGGTGAGTADQPTGDANGGTADEPVMGPEAPADSAPQTVTTLSRSSQSVSDGPDATTLAFAALASDAQTTDAGDKKDSVFATL